jgi:hypothetical protein
MPIEKSCLKYGVMTSENQINLFKNYLENILERNALRLQSAICRHLCRSVSVVGEPKLRQFKVDWPTLGNLIKEMSSIYSSPSSLQEEVPAVTRKRNALACVECNRRKKKCVQDAGSQSCYYCSSKSIPCAFPSRDVKRARKQPEQDLESSTSDEYSLVNNNDYNNKWASISIQEGSSDATIVSPSSNNQSPVREFHDENRVQSSRASTILIKNWTHANFAEKNTEESWIESYYATVYPSLPLLDNPWLTKNMIDIPLALLHVIYACSQITAFPTRAENHYRQALKMQFEDFDRADLLTIVTLLHFHYFESDSDIANNLYFSTAIKFAILLELDKSYSYSWVSPNGNLMG